VGYIEQTLGAGERVICSTRLHWIVFAGALLLLAIGIGVMLVPASTEQQQYSFIGVGGMILMLAPFVALRALIRRTTTEIAATTRRFVVKRGLLRRAVMEINAGQLESVSVYQSALGRLLGYGTIVAGGTGSGIDPVGPVARPLELRDALNQISARPPPGPAVVTPLAPVGGPRGGAAAIIGDNKFAFPVVGESHHEEVLAALAGGYSEKGVSLECAALLMPQPDNPYDPGAVAVFIRGHEVGYLARNVAPEFLQALASGGYDRAASEAMIVGGWDRGGGDRGNFGVRLNACRPFRLEPAADWTRRSSRR